MSARSVGRRPASTTSTTTAIAQSPRTSGTSTSRRSAASIAIATARSIRPNSSALTSTMRATTTSTTSTGTTTAASSGRNGTAAPAVFTDLDRNRDGVLSRFEVVGGVDTPNDTWDQFASLDYDRNGSLARDEWHWSSRVVQPPRHESRRQALAAGIRSRRWLAWRRRHGGDSGTSETVRVNSQQRWTDSGIVVRAGDTVTLDASGNIQMSDDAQDTANPTGSTTGRRAPDAPVLNQPAGGLIAQIDNYGPIFVGGRRSFTAPVSGRLYFGVNDDHLADNRGEFAVNVNVASR